MPHWHPGVEHPQPGDLNKGTPKARRRDHRGRGATGNAARFRRRNFWAKNFRDRQNKRKRLRNEGTARKAVRVHPQPRTNFNSTKGGTKVDPNRGKAQELRGRNFYPEKSNPQNNAKMPMKGNRPLPRNFTKSQHRWRKRENRREKGGAPGAQGPGSFLVGTPMGI